MCAAIFICSSVFVRIPLVPLLRKSLEFALVFHAPLTGIDVGKGDLTVENSPVCLVFDRSEVPFEEEGTEGDTEGEEEESQKNYGEVIENAPLVQMERRHHEDENAAQENWLNGIEISHTNWGRLPSFSSRNSHEIHGFHGILAFWRKKESEAEEAAEAL
ncbi:hypothetical protein H6P81_008586 [Aristolochia fimbriata]|uniref:Uncharacterized protein n=1 Tax=Aristolochia fimbriata TaxID=158543 RepID=A0AAV7ELS6_ARIFI|nr:hypothetical protein H6P81_008586 [Aristolochia fimbriata]